MNRVSKPISNGFICGGCRRNETQNILHEAKAEQNRNKSNRIKERKIGFVFYVLRQCDAFACSDGVEFIHVAVHLLL